MQNVPCRGLVGMNDSARCNPRPDQRNGGALARYDERNGTTADLTRDDYNLPLAGLFFGEPTINALCFAVLLLLVAAGIEAINVNLAGKFGSARIMDDRADCFPKFVRQHESRLVLAIQIAA